MNDLFVMRRPVLVAKPLSVTPGSPRCKYPSSCPVTNDRIRFKKVFYIIISISFTQPINMNFQNIVEKKRNPSELVEDVYDCTASPFYSEINMLDLMI